MIIILIAGYLIVNGDSFNEEQTCGIQNCHGLEISCGQNLPEFCTEIYQLGDFCRDFIECGIVNENCQLIENPKFNECKSCVEKCNEFTGIEAFACEDDCREKLI